MQPYGKDFFEWVQIVSLRSAKAVVPYVLELIKPDSAVDVGCGTGAWLSVLKEYGVKECIGVDGDYVDRNLLQIAEKDFIAFDLTKPFRLNRSFDLVVSLEVAEHLPIECADIFVDTLTSLGPLILFSAAIPFQGGVHHINEQWPEYWADLFQRRGYKVIDCIRKKIWNNDAVEWWWKQNILIFVREDYLDQNPTLKKEYENTNLSQLSIVHPQKYLEVVGHK